MATHSSKMAILIFSLFAISITSYPGGYFFGNAFAQSGNSTTTASNSTATAEPEIKLDAGFATFSYGVVFVEVNVENAIPGTNQIDIEYYNPDGALVETRSETLSINNGTGTFGCYCFEIERKYVEDSYKIVATYAGDSETFVLPPFSDTYGQPPSISFHASEQTSVGVHIGGRVSGGIGGEQVNVAIYPEDGDSPLWEKTVESNGKVIFEVFINGSEAQDLLPTGTYRVVATHIATGVTGETTLDYTNPSQTEEPEPEPATEPERPAAPKPDDSEIEEDDEEHVVDGQPDGTIRSPFVFEDGTDSPATTASMPAENNAAIQTAASDNLVINGTLASYYILNGTGQEADAQVYILAGNWSMSVNSTAITDFAANFTIVRSDGAVRSAYSIDNFAAVNASDVQLNSDSMVFASAADIRKGDDATRENLIFTIAKLNVIKIEFGSDASNPAGRPIYGVVDSLILAGGQSVLPR